MWSLFIEKLATFYPVGYSQSMSARLSVADFITGIDVDFAAGDFTSPSLTIPIADATGDVDFQPVAPGLDHDRIVVGAEAYEGAIAAIPKIERINEFLYDRADAKPEDPDADDDEDADESASLGTYDDYVFSENLIHDGVVISQYYDSVDRVEAEIAKPAQPGDEEFLADFPDDYPAKVVDYLRGQFLFSDGVSGHSYAVAYRAAGDIVAQLFVNITAPQEPEVGATILSDADFTQRLLLQMSAEHVVRLLREAAGVVVDSTAGEIPLETMRPMELAIFLARYYLAAFAPGLQKPSIQFKPKRDLFGKDSIDDEGTGTDVVELQDPMTHTVGTYFIRPPTVTASDEGVAIRIEEGGRIAIEQIVLPGSPTGFIPTYLRLAQAIKTESLRREAPGAVPDEAPGEVHEENRPTPFIYWQWWLQAWYLRAREGQPRCPRRLGFGLRGSFTGDLAESVCRNKNELRAWVYTQLAALVAKGELPRDTARAMLEDIADIVQEDSDQTDPPALSAALHTLLEQVGPAH